MSYSTVNKRKAKRKTSRTAVFSARQPSVSKANWTSPSCSQAGYCLKNSTCSSQCSLNFHGSVPLLTLFWLFGVSFSLLLTPRTWLKNQFKCLLGETIPGMSFALPCSPTDLWLVHHRTPGCLASYFMAGKYFTDSNKGGLWNFRKSPVLPFGVT